MPPGSDAEDRHIILDGQPNFRDLGGYTSSDGRSTRRGLLYRSGELSALSSPDCDRLSELGLGLCIDLRSASEIEERGADMLPTDTTWVHIPIDEANNLKYLLTARFAAGDFSAPDADLMVEVNRALARDWVAEFGRLIREIAASESPVVFHCTHGKDRAGLGAAMLLNLLGVPWETVEYDYLLSNRCRADENEAQLAQISAAAAAQADSAAEAVDLTWMRGLFYVEARYLDAAWAEIEKAFGSVEDLARVAAGVDDNDLESLRGRLLERDE